MDKDFFLATSSQPGPDQQQLSLPRHLHLLSVANQINAMTRQKECLIRSRGEQFIVEFLFYWNEKKTHLFDNTERPTIGRSVRRKQYYVQIPITSNILPFSLEKMTGGTPEVRSDKSLTLLTLNI